MKILQWNVQDGAHSNKRKQAVVGILKALVNEFDPDIISILENTNSNVPDWRLTGQLGNVSGSILEYENGHSYGVYDFLETIETNRKRPSVLIKLKNNEISYGVSSEICPESNEKKNVLRHTIEARFQDKNVNLHLCHMSSGSKLGRRIIYWNSLGKPNFIALGDWNTGNRYPTDVPQKFGYYHSASLDTKIGYVICNCSGKYAINKIQNFGEYTHKDETWKDFFVSNVPDLKCTIHHCQYCPSIILSRNKWPSDHLPIVLEIDGLELGKCQPAGGAEGD